METLNIVFVTPRYKPYIGGVEYVVENLAREMFRRGHLVTVFTLTTFVTNTGYCDDDGVIVRRFMGFSPLNAYHLPLPRFFSQLKMIRADVVDVHAVHALTAPCSWLVKNFGVRWGRFVVTPHYLGEGHSWHSRVAWRFYKPTVRALCVRADIVHSISTYETKLLKRDFGINSVLVPNGVSDDVMLHHWRPGERLKVIFAGRLERFKRVDRLIRAVRLVQDKEPDASLVVLGQGSEGASLKKLAQKLQVSVSFPGFLPRQSYLSELSTSTCMVNLSPLEVYNLSTAEALSIGLPSIVVKPWGSHFSWHPRAIVLEPNPPVEVVADSILKSRSYEDKASISFPTWSQVGTEVEKRIYYA